MQNSSHRDVWLVETEQVKCWRSVGTLGLQRGKLTCTNVSARRINIPKKMTRLTKRVLVTPEAEAVIERLRKEHGELMFHQSGGCCDGSQPMCFEKGEFKVGENDVYLGDIDGCAFFMARDQFEYWKHTQLTVGVVPGRGSSFSLEIPLGLRFIIRSRLFEEKEISHLAPVVNGEEYYFAHQ